MSKREILISALNAAKIAAKYDVCVRKRCDEIFLRQLRTYSTHQILKCIKYIVSHCGPRIIARMNNLGVFKNTEVTLAIGKYLQNSGLGSVQCLNELMRRYRSLRAYQDMLEDDEGDLVLLACAHDGEKVNAVRGNQEDGSVPSTSGVNIIAGGSVPSISGVNSRVKIIEDLMIKPPLKINIMEDLMISDTDESDTEHDREDDNNPITDSDTESVRSPSSNRSSPIEIVWEAAGQNAGNNSSIDTDNAHAENPFQTGRGRGGEGVQDEDHIRNYFQIQSETSRYFPRFRLTGRDINGRICEPSPDTDVFSWLEKCMEALHNYICAQTDADDFIGLTINSDKFRGGPLWLSFRPVDSFHFTDLWSLLSSAVQSTSDFGTGDNLNINVSIVKVIRGCGRVSLSSADVHKKSILIIRNDDNLCLPRSLVTAYAYAQRGQTRSGSLHHHWEMIRDGRRPFQKEKALELVEVAEVSVPLDIGYGLADIDAFQLYFARQGVAIVVYAFHGFGRGDTPIYDGTDRVRNTGSQILHTLRIMFYEHLMHYQPILNIIAAAGSRKYCIPCNKRFTQHHKCDNECRKCKRKPPCNEDIHVIKCEICFRNFFGVSCIEYHLKRGSFDENHSVCEKIKYCQSCNKIIQHQAGENHVCGIVFCNTCNAKLPLDHFCFVQPIKSTNQSRSRCLYLFYDFETQQCQSVQGDSEIKIHVPTLCVVQQSCESCFDNTDISERCAHCGVREYIFKTDPVKQLVELAIQTRRNLNKVIAIAHNSQGFDAQFILKYIVEKHCSRDLPTLIMNGSKIVLLEYMNVKFIDSLNYFHMALSELPSAYGIPDTQKGTFPHLFNTPENQNYIGELPDLHYYAPDNMRPASREKLITWHREQREANHIFNFQLAIEKYCKQDVTILRLACAAFRKTFLTCGDVCPFSECSTIASACLRVFRKKFLKVNQIGVIPIGGYRRSDNQSKKALAWLYWMEKSLGLNIQHSGGSREKRLPNGILVDGYCHPIDENDENRGVVFQYHGCFWHGCPHCYRVNRNATLTNTGETMDSRYERTRLTSERIRNGNYRLVEVWECAFDRELKVNSTATQFVKSIVSDLIALKPLDPRNAFFGGRTDNTVKIYDCKDGEKIRYVDVCSLYPYICKTGKYPIGHPKVYVGTEDCRKLLGNTNDVRRVNGLIMCDVLPPQNLIHPVLPVKMHGKLLFPLCRTCADQLIQEDCPHEDVKDRLLTGTWVSDEIWKAVDLGYSVIKVHEIWQYDITQYDPGTREGGLFAGYIDEFFTQKVLASGYPPQCVTDNEKNVYVSDLQCQNMVFNKEDIRYNAGLRSVAKLCLNSLWGKFGQRENMSKAEVISDATKLTELLNNPEINVTGLLPVNDEKLYVNWCYKDEAVIASPTANVVIAAYTTAQARLKLHSYLEKLQSRVLYYDTDSVVYVSSGKEGEYELPIGTMLGDLTDELSKEPPGSYISSFISGGPKFYAYKIYSPDGHEKYVHKVKGITLNYLNCQKIKFDTIRKMILGDIEEITVSNQSIRRTKFHDVVTRREQKTCKPVYHKRRFVSVDRSYPYGYREF